MWRRNASDNSNSLAFACAPNSSTVSPSTPGAPPFLLTCSHAAWRVAFLHRRGIIEGCFYPVHLGSGFMGHFPRPRSTDPRGASRPLPPSAALRRGPGGFPGHPAPALGRSLCRSLLHGPWSTRSPSLTSHYGRSHRYYDSFRHPGPFALVSLRGLPVLRFGFLAPGYPFPGRPSPSQSGGPRASPYPQDGPIGAAHLTHGPVVHHTRFPPLRRGSPFHEVAGCRFVFLGPTPLRFGPSGFRVSTDTLSSATASVWLVPFFGHLGFSAVP